MEPSDKFIIGERTCKGFYGRGWDRELDIPRIPWLRRLNDAIGPPHGEDWTLPYMRDIGAGS